MLGAGPTGVVFFMLILDCRSVAFIEVEVVAGKTELLDGQGWEDGG